VINHKLNGDFKSHIIFGGIQNDKRMTFSITRLLKSPLDLWICDWSLIINVWSNCDFKSYIIIRGIWVRRLELLVYKSIFNSNSQNSLPEKYVQLSTLANVFFLFFYAVSHNLSIIFNLLILNIISFFFFLLYSYRHSIKEKILEFYTESSGIHIHFVAPVGNSLKLFTWYWSHSIILIYH
jgi:hypothetical protein